MTMTGKVELKGQADGYTRVEVHSAGRGSRAFKTKLTTEQIVALITGQDVSMPHNDLDRA
jgi:hypothetical protein